MYNTINNISEKNLKNNQNYILGKKEKKKLLSNFFKNKSNNNLLKTINFISNTIYYLSFIIISIGIIGYLIYSNGFYFLLIFQLIPIYFYMFLSIYFIYKNREQLLKSNIENFIINKDYINSNDDLKYIQVVINFFILYLIFGFFIYYYYPPIFGPNYYFSTKLFFGIIFLQIIVPTIIHILFKNITLRINYLNIIFFPIFLLIAFIYQIIYTLCLLIYVLIKGTKGYYFLKTTPNLKLFIKYKLKNSKITSNKYYSIILK